MHALAEYSGVARQVVLAYKERRRHDLAAGLGLVLALAVAELPGVRRLGAGAPLWLVPAPSRRSAARQRGGPHVARLTRCVTGRLESARSAHLLGLDNRAQDSVGLKADERLANLRRGVHLTERRGLPEGSPVLLVDDVVTTGATAAVCAGLLRGSGLRVLGLLALTGPAGRLEPELDTKKILRKSSW
ncbi:putative amidophosphoribosyltransferase [Crossiella equi]|uniref:Amidophosphoribosyltransferase n=1 Tax=Crossiella equi TaxID=130796 RepID=A0ABS5ADB1_9PSEU|nr:ComF family protein [Crossiella equi]MBP2474566.1 putative amidophosphoribosyltransferase [Crossiella equi]